MSDQFCFDPGALNERLPLENIQELSDGCGGVTVSWLPIANVWALLRPVSAKSALRAQQLEETTTHRIIIRFRDDIASGWRFRKGTRNFVVKTVIDPDERGRYLVCLAEEEGR